VVLAVQGVVAVLFAITAGRWSEVRPPLVTSTRGERRTILVRPRWRAKSRAVAGLLIVAPQIGFESVVGLWLFAFLLDAMAFEPVTAGLEVSGYGPPSWSAVCGAWRYDRTRWDLARLGGATAMAVTADALVVSQQPAFAAASWSDLPPHRSIRCWYSPLRNGQPPASLTGWSTSKAAALSLDARHVPSAVGLIIGASTALASCLLVLVP
jgi:hypothetical protein